MKKLVSLLLLMPLLAAAARAGDLAVWNTTGSQPAAAAFPATSNATGLAVADLVRGTGLQTHTTPANTFSAKGYDTASYAAAVNGKDYWETMLSPDDGYALSLSELVYTFRSTKTGPQSWQWTYSTNGTAFTAVGDPGAYANDKYTEATLPLAAVSALQNLTAPVWFRLYAWGASSASGTGVFGQKKDAIIFRGSAVDISGPPEITISGLSSVAVSNTLTLLVSVLPFGSTITSCAFTARPAGATSWDAASGTFSFTPAAADFGKTFTLRAVARNNYGTSTNTHAVAVTEYVPLGSYVLDFEDGTKTAYAAADVELHGVVWTLDNVVIGTGTNDHKNGNRAARFNYSAAGAMTSKAPVTETGVGEVTFSSATYGNYQTGAVLRVEVSPDAASWVSIGFVETAGANALAPSTFPVGTADPLYLRFRVEAGTHDSVNLDDILVTPYSPPAAGSYEDFLLQYNVTPGDSLTEPADDYDGDGFSNNAEYTASTNPYDPESHP